jgi:hypothetical protein
MAWVKKIEKEENNKRKNKPNFTKDGIIVFIVLFLFYIIKEKFFGIHDNYTPYTGNETLQWNEIKSNIPNYLLTASLGALFVIIFEFFTGFSFFPKSPSNTYICDNCNKSKNYDEKMECECGGKFFHIDDMEWIDKNSSG